MRIDLTVRDRDGIEHDLGVRAPTGTQLGDLGAALAEATGCRSDDWYSGRRRLGPSTALGSAGLRTGDVLSTITADEPDPTDAAVLRLQVVGGPDSGQVLAASRGLLTVGRAAHCDLVITDPRVSRRHASLTVGGAGVTVHDLGSTNGTRIEQCPVGPDGAALGAGQLLQVGDSYLSLVENAASPAAVRAGPEGRRLVNRSPRIRIEPAARTLDWPVSPDSTRPQRARWAAALVPAGAGVGLAWWMHAPQFLLFALLSPLALIGTTLGDRVHWRRSRRREAAVHRHRLTAARGELDAGIHSEVTVRRAHDPDPATVLAIATTPTSRLWERRRDDADGLLRVRLGLTTRPSRLAVRRGNAVEPAATLTAVPISVDLAHGPLGIAAPNDIGTAIARWLVGQLAALASPSDLEIALLLSDSATPRWAWARWLPQVRGRVAVTSADRQALVADLGSLVELRGASTRPGDRVGPAPWLTMVVDRAGEMSELPGLASLLATGVGHGLTAICLDERENRLPTACAYVIRTVGDTGSRVSVRGRDVGQPDVVADQVGPRWAERVARALAPLVDSGGDAAAALPDQCRLTELLGVSELDPADVRARWSQSSGRASTVIGVGPDGPVRIDLDRDGPHALVAGTTGSGKSELLQSLVVGLALDHPPEEITFVLVDYKGGAAFSDCARLPHTAGLVTDLDEHLTRRALMSLNCELRRREQLFSAVGAKDLATYAASGPATPVARLVLVIDEFAALNEELPDFLTGLIGIAQRGRSLGVHLVLATQRPAGAVSPEIRANTSLRIALRTTGAAESTDVIDSPEAAGIDRRRPGRAYLRAGAELTALQAAYVGGRAGAGSTDPVSITRLGPWRRAADDETFEAGESELAHLVDALRAAAASSGRDPVRRPWLPPLPDRLSLSELADHSEQPVGDGNAERIPFGRLDLPGEQRQRVAQLDLGSGGSVLLVGGPRSGRTSALVTLAVSAALGLGPQDLHLYAIDAAGEGLGPLIHLPQCATMTRTGDGFGTTGRLLQRLDAEVARRRTLLAELGQGSVADARAAGHSIPLVLCVLDGWEAFVAAAEEHDGGRTVERLLSLVRAAPAAGLTIALTGDRGALAPRLAGSIATKLLLPLADRGDYALAGAAPRSVPEHRPPGRAVRADDGAELQLAFLGAEPTRAEQERIVADARAYWRDRGPDAGAAGSGHAPIRIRPLPSRIALTRLPPTPGRLRLGLGGDSAQLVAIDPFDGDQRLLVVGPARSGRTTTLRTLMVQATRDTRIVLAAGPRSALIAIATCLGATTIRPGPDESVAVDDSGRTLLLVDDSEAFLDTATGDWLTAWVRRAPPGLAAVVAARTDELTVTFRGVAAEVRRSRLGLLLQPGPVDGELLGIRLPRQRYALSPGRGILVGDPAWGPDFADGPIPLQVALASDEDELIGADSVIQPAAS